MDAAWPPNWPTQADELHIFDPKGDVLLLLNRHLPQEDMTDYVDREFSLLSQEDIEVVPAVELNLARPYTPSRPSCSSLFAVSSSSPTQELELGSQPVQMRVSSKHLIHASCTFCTSLNSFSAGHMLQTERNVTLTFPDEEPDVMIVLLHIIHGQNRKVPRQVSLAMLTKLAAAVNYHRIQEAVELFADIWMEDLKKCPLPTSYTSEVLPWLFIFWVFRKKDGFRNMTRILHQESDDNLEDEANAVPTIPASIISTIQIHRINGIKNLIRVIRDLISKYSGADTLCDNDWWACDAFVLGMIIKSSAAIGVWPQTDHTYPGLTYKAMVKRIQQIKVPVNCGNPMRPVSDDDDSDLHGIKEVIKASMKTIEDQMSGLELEHFLPTQDRERRHL
ncbi:hypothetical protein V502_05040 [Pseudogymnoascus sp. VKM F-4520 (FW-2644)]|nr:hypothetical protein V502_05040 [Pseudogymnoascus sp. VKM F-4520 (FW-2644)]